MGEATKAEDAQGRRGTSPRSKVIVSLVVGACFVLTGWSMFEAKYLEPQRIMADGVAGTFTLSSCERMGGTSSGGETHCVGTLRSDAGETLAADIELSEKHDASDLHPGASVAVRARLDGPREVDRDDETGRANIRQNGIGSAGIGVVGLMTAGLGAMTVWRTPGRARRVVMTLLVIGVLTGAAMWIGGLTAGGGILT